MNALEWHKPHERSIQYILYSHCRAGYFPPGRGFFRSRGEIAEPLVTSYLPVMPQSKYQRVREFLLLHFAPHGVPEVTWKRPASMILFRARFVQVFAAARTISEFVVLQA